MIICGFPGVGKTTAYNRALAEGLNAHDSDSSHWAKTDQWARNYVEHVVRVNSQMDEQTACAVFASTHKEVRDELTRLGVYYVLVYPSRAQKIEYISRYISRGSPQAFIDLMEERFDSFIEELESQTHCKHVVLGPNQFLADVLKEIGL